MKNVWKPVQHLWEINESGSIRNINTKKPLTVRLRRDGYLDIKLSYKRFLVHRLVAISFLPNPDNKKQVNHKDGDRSNPNIDNLEWVDQFENMKHAVETGLFPSRVGEKNGRATITAAQAVTIKDLLSGGWAIKQICFHMKVSYGVVTNIKRGLTWK